MKIKVIVLILIITVSGLIIIISKIWLVSPYPLLWSYAGTGDIIMVNELLKKGVNVDERAKGSWHWTPLINASVMSQTEVVETLLKAGADPNKQDSQGRTALHFVFGKPQIAHLLLSHGADPTIMDKYGTSPLNVALDNPNDDASQEIINYNNNNKTGTNTHSNANM
jgi:ankyrin repeat protein